MTAPSTRQLMRVVALARETIAQLQSEHGQVLETDADALEALAQEGVDVHLILRGLIQASLEAASLAAGARGRIADLQARVARFDRQEEVLRDTALQVMQALEIKKFPDAEFTLSIRTGQPKVIITDPDLLPDALVKIEVTRTPDKIAVRQAIEDRNSLIAALRDQGSSILPPPFAGAVLANARSTLAIRTR